MLTLDRPPNRLLGEYYLVNHRKKRSSRFINIVHASIWKSNEKKYIVLPRSRSLCHPEYPMATGNLLIVECEPFELVF